jgi:glycerol kinase
METKIIAIDQSTSATKALLFSPRCERIAGYSLAHKQYYPKPGWVEHDAEEICRNTLAAVRHLMLAGPAEPADRYSLCLTNQRETVAVWNRHTGKPLCHAVVWQCTRGADTCNELIRQGHAGWVQQKTGLLIDPYFSASGIKWILDHVRGAAEAAQNGDLLAGTMDSWLIWNLTGGTAHLTDYTNASRTLLFNIHTLDWDDDLLRLFHIPRSMMPRPLPCDAVFGETTLGGLFDRPIPIAGALGDSHAALAGQMCFEQGLAKATYGTGSSVMVNIGPTAAPPPRGLLTCVAFAALGKTFYAFEGNIHCAGATIRWLEKNLGLINSPQETEAAAASVADAGGVYFVPAFTGLGAPWWQPAARAAILGMTLATGKAHILRAALESIAYQVNDLVHAMTGRAGISLKELRADGGATQNSLLMQFQADLLRVPVQCLHIEEASALGAALMNGLARKTWNSFEELAALQAPGKRYHPQAEPRHIQTAYRGWIKAVRTVMSDKLQVTSDELQVTSDELEVTGNN